MSADQLESVPDHVVVNASTQKMHCLCCNDAVPIPTGDLRWVCAVMSAFAFAHKDTTHSGGHTGFTEPIIKCLNAVCEHHGTDVCLTPSLAMIGVDNQCMGFEMREQKNPQRQMSPGA